MAPFICLIYTQLLFTVYYYLQLANYYFQLAIISSQLLFTVSYYLLLICRAQPEVGAVRAPESGRGYPVYQQTVRPAGPHLRLHAPGNACTYIAIIFVLISI